jgi:hypothetical protein
MKVAICSSNGVNVDLHFGKTSTFYIYEIAGGAKEFIETRDIDAYCVAEEFPTSDPDHKFEQEKFDPVYKTISDCKKLYTVQVGDTPKLKLEEKGITVQLCSCPIDEIPTCNCKCKK